MNGTWPWSQFCFPCDVVFLGQVALDEDHFWLPPCLGAGDNVKAAAKMLSSFLTWVLKASQNCSASLNPYCTDFTCLDPNWWEFDRRKMRVPLWLVLTAVREVEALESKACWCWAGEVAVWASEVWKEQNPALNQLLLRAVAVSQGRVHTL